jgi:hypothetical protein
MVPPQAPSFFASNHDPRLASRRAKPGSGRLRQRSLT